MKTIKYSEKITEFSPSKSTPCWSVYVAATAVSGGTYAEGHSYGLTRDEAISAAREKLREKLSTVSRSVWAKI